MNTISKVTVSFILAILLVVISSGSNRIIQVKAQITTTQCHEVAGKPGQKVCSGKIEVPWDECLHLHANMANDTADHWYAMMYEKLGCAEIAHPR